MQTPAPALEIDFVSDVVCPWCAVGLNSLLIALERLGPALGDVTLRFGPFELNPQMPAEGEDIVEHLSRKYGMTAAQVASNQDGLRQRGAAVGFDFRMDRRSRTWNTFDAHRLLHWAGLQDNADAQRRLKHALLKAYHGEGRNPGDREVLLDLAGQVGLDVEGARQVLDSDTYALDVRAAEQQWQRAGISSVPAIVINQRHLISGGQPPEVFEQALRQIAAESTPA